MENVEHKETYKKWKTLVNMSRGELEKFYNSQEGIDAGLSSQEASEQGISSGRESARWIMKMKDTNVSDWTPSMWRWAKKQISFISRMSGNKGPLYDDKGNKTRKHTSLLIWGNNPEKYSEGGLIAPNREPSNLTPEQYHLVRTSAFKKWFGDWENYPETASKVVDENGEPLVVRHFSQTNNKFYIFKEKAKKHEWSVSQKGIYFTSLNAKELNDAYNRTGKGILYEVFLNIRNLLDLGIYDTYDFINEKPVFWKNHHFEMLDKYVTKGRIGQFDNYTEFEANVDYTTIQVISEKSKNKILKLGYNGIWGNKSNDIYDTIDEIVVFYPNQIKLADGSNTTFDSSNPDIRYTKGGDVKNKVFVHETDAKTFDKFDLKFVGSGLGSGQGDQWLGRGIYLQEKGSFKIEKYGKNKVETTLKPNANIFKVKDKKTDGKYRDNFVEWAVENTEVGKRKAQEIIDNGWWLYNLLPRDILKSSEAVEKLKEQGYDGLYQDGELVIYNPDVLQIKKFYEFKDGGLIATGLNSFQQLANKYNNG